MTDEQRKVCESEADDIIRIQREYVKRNPFPAPEDRKTQLKKLRSNIKDMEDEICDALYADLGKSRTESYMSEIGMALSEISFMIRHVKKFSKTKRVRTGMANFPSKSYIMPCPYGSVLILSPWNYPFMLSVEPLAEAVAAGNSVILRPSSSSPNVSQVLKELIERTFDVGKAAVVLGDREIGAYLAEQKFDYVFFTGSASVGKTILHKAAETVTPVTLELGGKSPCIVDDTANIPLAARRIVFGKFLNSGQTCVAPDYVYCAESVMDELIDALKKEIVRQYGNKPLENDRYPRIVNERQFDRLTGYIDHAEAAGEVLFGGASDASAMKIEPTIVRASFDDPVMGDEIFGPVLPVMSFSSLDGAIERINDGARPLAAYLFSEDASNRARFLSDCRFGGGCINDTIMHISGSRLPFGGLQESGMGSYHGRNGFDTFTHFKSVLDKSTKIDMPFRYSPVGRLKSFFIRMFLK